MHFHFNKKINPFSRLFLNISLLSGSNYTHEQLVNLSKKHNVLTGKWLIDISPTNVLKDWPRIRNATLQSKLGCTTKISDEPDGTKKSHIVCIYCPDFTGKSTLVLFYDMNSFVQYFFCSV